MLINETESLWANKKSNGSQESPDVQDELDSSRTVPQMCEQKVGGSCGTMARVFAELLIRSGIPADNVRIVSAASDPDLRRLCEGRSGQGFNSRYMGPPPNGHVFVLVKDGEQWRLINTTPS